MTWGVFLFLFVLTAVMIFEPIHYGRAAWAACTKALDIWSGFFGIIIGYLFGAGQMSNEQDLRPLSKMQKNLAWGIFCVLAVVSLVTVLYPLHYGKFADKECAVVIDIWSALFGGVIGFYFKNQNQGRSRTDKVRKNMPGVKAKDKTTKGGD
jgi:membrane protease YdiL (CAAX protease family)